MTSVSASELRRTVRSFELEHAARTQTETAITQLTAIQRVTEAALAHLNLDDLLNMLLDRIAETLEVDTVAVLLLEEDGGNVLVARAAKGIEEEVEQGNASRLERASQVRSPPNAYR